ncbi:MAG: helicase-exonuclease AddAB subunit AddB [Anaerocolumna sp.]
MSLQLILGKSGSGKSYTLYHEIIHKSIENPHTNYLMIVPEQFTLQTQKDIVDMHPSKGTMNIDILSFMRLAYRVFDEVGGADVPVLEDFGKTMVLRKLISRLSKDLDLFGHDVYKQGFIEELKSLLSEIYQYSINIDSLKEIHENLNGSPLLKGKLHDLIAIYEAFKNYLEEKYITAEEVLDVLYGVIVNSQMIKESVICFDGFTGFTPSQYKLLSILLKNAKKVIITITMDQKELHKSEEEFKLFHLSKKNMDRIIDIAKDEGIMLDPFVYMENRNHTEIPIRFKDNNALAVLEANLFRYPYKTYPYDQDSISIHVTRDMNQEVQYVIREIKSLVHTKNYRYQDIAIITGDMASYGRELRRGFEKENIPCFVDEKRNILANPYVELIRASLSIIADNYSYESIFRYLRCGLSSVSSEDIDMLENYCIACGIRGYSKWQTPWTKGYKGQNEGELTRINEVRELIFDSLEPLKEVFHNKENTVKDFTTGLYLFGLSLDIPKKMEEFSNTFLSNNQLSKAKEYSQVYGMVMELFDKLVELLGEEKMPLKEYIEVLEAGLKEAKVGLIPPGLDQIMVGDIERTRLKNIKALFIVGANDGIIPKNAGGKGILTDMERERLKSKNLEMAPTKRQAIYTERFYLYLNMTKPSEKLYVSFSRVNEEGKAILPAFIIDNLVKLFPKIKLVDEDIFREDLEHILQEDKGIHYLIKGIREFPEGEPGDIFKELFSYYHGTKGTREILEAITRAVYHRNENLKISKETALELYGKILSGSVTRFEQFAACSFAHFAAYGLELKERVEYKLLVPDIGNLFHNALEIFSKKLEKSEYNWHTLAEEVRELWCDSSVREAVKSYGSSIFESTNRYHYLIHRVERITKRTVWALSEQIKRGDFEPAAYEMLFSDRDRLKSLFMQIDKESGLGIRGRIDRLDICEDEDNLYVRVIDYKSGSTSFDLNSLYYGLQIQLAVYMNASMELLQRENKDKAVIPAGLLYYKIDDPYVDKNSQIEETILKELKMDGLVSSDPQIIKHQDHSFLSADDYIKPSVKSLVIPVESSKDGHLTKRSNAIDIDKFKMMEGYVKDIVVSFGEEIIKGNADISPFQRGDKKACDYCPYQGVCGFDKKIDGYQYNKLKDLTTEEIWSKMSRNNEEEESSSHELD